jgi:hypothetical protein
LVAQIAAAEELARRAEFDADDWIAERPRHCKPLTTTGGQTMSERALVQVEPSRRRSRHLESPRAFIQRLQAEFPNDPPENIGDRYLAHVRDVVSFDDAQDELYVLGPLTEWLRANVVPVRKKPKRGTQAEATGTVVAQIAKADEERVERIVSVRLLEYQTTYGKTLGDCTGAECKRLGRQYGGFFTEVAKRLTPGQRVRNHLTELELQGIATTHRLVPA